jgi:hypothetical protein
MHKVRGSFPNPRLDSVPESNFDGGYSYCSVSPSLWRDDEWFCQPRLGLSVLEAAKETSNGQEISGMASPPP